MGLDHPTVDNSMDIYLGEIRLMTGLFGETPEGWAECNGQQINTQENEPLAYLIHRKYGNSVDSWDPKIATFALPNLAPLRDSDYEGETKYYIALKGKYPLPEGESPEYWFT